MSWYVLQWVTVLLVVSIERVWHPLNNGGSCFVLLRLSVDLYSNRVILHGLNSGKGSAGRDGLHGFVYCCCNN